MAVQATPDASRLRAFFGVWELDPSTCDYGELPAPTATEYTLLPAGASVSFHVRWTDDAGTVQQTSFAAIPDGSERALQDGLLLTCALHEGRLLTEVRNNDVSVHRAARTLDDAAEAMTVTQWLQLPDGVARTRAVYRRTRVKQVLAYRRDLKMRKGKIAAQCAHASMKVFFDRDEGDAHRMLIPIEGAFAWWSRAGFAKVVLSLDDEEALLTAYQLALEAGLPAALITDAGRTEFGGVPTRTAIAIGPAIVSRIDAITGPGGAVKTKLA